MPNGTHNHDSLPELLAAIDPKTLIPVVEKGLEIVQLESLVADESETKQCIRSSRILLSFLRTRGLGL